MKALLIILFVFLFLLILYFFSSYTAYFTKVETNNTDNFYLLGKAKIEQGRVSSLNFTLD
ncbi:MAG: hypothetical protein ACP5O8_02245 [Candidatus Aenigmatarchaeota archaeon]